ncbi:hypothetical protein BDQ17DRAFT_1429552 [Cyathus striatus]|nr:hypothetical protein BDQ17DRAFT_1429552 [Cyathus striatus]
MLILPVDACVEHMKPILAQPGFISKDTGAGLLRSLYTEGSDLLFPEDLSEFGCVCFVGMFGEVKELYQSGKAPDLSGTKTSYNYGYVAIIIRGAQNLLKLEGSQQLKHYEILKYLISKGLALDVPDILGMTALHHTAQLHAESPTGSIVKLLLKFGAYVNTQNRYGESPIVMVQI